MTGHAVIVGGGIAGLLAGHAAARCFDRVTILERFSLPGARGPAARHPFARRGVPQSRCIHLLMASGVAAFDALAPGWQDELAAHGAGPFDACADASIRVGGGRLPRARSDIRAYAASRALFEQALRRRLPATVRLQQNRKVLGLIADARGERVRGVVVQEITQDRRAGGRTTLDADLVVDASGEGSLLSRWLAGLPADRRSPIEKSVVASGARYVSRWFELAPADAPDWRCLSIAPGGTVALRSAMILRAEDNRWGVVLLARGDDMPPADDGDFADFIASLGDRELTAMLARARPLSPILRYGSTANRLLHYERLAGWPQGLVAIGDAVCTLDPCHGLGMTLAARAAALLRTALDEAQGRAGSAALSAPLCAGDFQQKLAAQNAGPWRLATGRAPGGEPVAGVPDPGRLHERAHSDPAAARALIAVQHLLRPAETLLENAP
jgi:2-polyprenyl-6-methoxyphenol hydroxylase-like FAD-dependent oxidoreductase